MNHGSSSSSSKTTPVRQKVRKLNDSVYEFYKPPHLPSMEILFFHGFQLGENYEDAHVTTWKSGDESCIWPKSWLVDEFPSARILSVSYQGGLTSRTRNEDIDFSRDVITENIMWNLYEANIGQHASCPIILAGHGFGGLLIKELCWHAHTNGIVGSVKDANFMKNVKGIFFYSTPHHGITVKLSERFVRRGPLLDYVKTLMTHAARSGENFERLRRYYGTWQTAGLGEYLHTRLNDYEKVIVVEESSSRYGDDFGMVLADHICVCRPMGKTSRQFYSLTRFLFKCRDRLGTELNLPDAQVDRPGPLRDDIEEICNDPITMDIMCDPVKCSDGRTYCRWTILDHYGMNRSPYDRKMKLEICCDDISIRSLLFRVFPAQASKFRERRDKHREEALQHCRAHPVQLEHAIEKLNNVLKWNPGDSECEKELAKLLKL